MQVQLIRNATLKLHYGGTTFLIDPYFADKYTQPSFTGKSKNPIIDLPLSIDEILKDIDCVIISHLHPDHFDEKAHISLPKDMKIFCQPVDYKTIKSFGFTNVDYIENTSRFEGIDIIRTSGQHGAGEIVNLMGEVSGFIFKHAHEKTIYWLGDTIFYSEVQKNILSHNPEVIICHAGGNAFTKTYNLFGDHFQGDSESLIMDKQQVVDLYHFDSSYLIIATHLEALDHDTVTRQALSQFAESQGIHLNRLFIPLDGETLTF